MRVFFQQQKKTNNEPLLLIHNAIQYCLTHKAIKSGSFHNESGLVTLHSSTCMTDVIMIVCHPRLRFCAFAVNNFSVIGTEFDVLEIAFDHF